VALEIEGSNPSTHPTTPAPIAQRTEHGSSDLALGVPNRYFTFKLELLYKLLKTCFVRKVPTGNNPFNYVY
jgi:hypothetical protein